MNLVWHIVSAILFLIFIGYMLDQYFHMSFICTLIGGILGMVYSIIISMRELNNKSS